MNGTKSHSFDGDSNGSMLPTAMSTSGLENKLRVLREDSHKHSQILTQKLATSQSGQNLLHMGSSLTTLPPSLHSLLTELHPILTQAEAAEGEQLKALTQLVTSAREIRMEQRRVQHAVECADLYADLQVAEKCVKAARQERLYSTNHIGSNGEAAENDPDATTEQLDRAAALERAAHITLCLVQELQSANEAMSTLTAAPSTPSSNRTVEGGGEGESSATLPSLLAPLPADTERAQFLMKLAPRIRKVEAEVIAGLGQRMESLLKEMQTTREHETVSGNAQGAMLGHCMRGLTIMGRSKEVESIFARVAIMPLIRTQLSMGRLDQGGSRGACAGLPALLDDLTESMADTYGPVLRLSESIFYVGDERDVDLLTAGVWVPLATALMTDSAIRMAIFSPGIASILQANWSALDLFLSELASRLLKEDPAAAVSNSEKDWTYRPTLSRERIQAAQNRIYAHPKTAEFSKKWNLPIYYQLRFGECCTRLNKAVERTQKEGWIAEVFGGPAEQADKLKMTTGFELSLFLEVYDVLLGLWKPDVILRPLTNRFLRGAIQLIGRVLAFITEGMEGTIMFGEDPKPHHTNGGSENGVSNETNGNGAQPMFPMRRAYCWGESEEDVAAVAWELTILDSSVRHDYVDTVCTSLETAESTDSEKEELQSIVSEVLKDASDQIRPVIDKAWNDKVVNILTQKCSAPLAAVKGVAATYRMTNRPPPTQASHFVETILRPLQEFNREFANRTPEQVGSRWKQQIVVTVSDRYAAAVEELLATVQRTEVALKNRKARRTAAGGMSDGEKVKLQLYLDYQAYAKNAADVGINVAAVLGLSKLKELTAEGESLRNQNGNGSQR